MDRFRASRNQRFSSPPNMVGEEIKQLSLGIIFASLNLTATLCRPNSNPVLTLRANHMRANFKIKELNKAIINQSRLLNKFLKE